MQNKRYGQPLQVACSLEGTDTAFGTCPRADVAVSGERERIYIEQHVEQATFEVRIDVCDRRRGLEVAPDEAERLAHISLDLVQQARK